MAGLKDVFREIRKIEDPSIGPAVAQALATAGRAEIPALALMLLERRDPASQLSLVMQFHRMPENVQQTIINHADELYRPLREAAGKHRTQGPANSLQIIRRSGSMRLAYLVAEQVRHGEDALRNLAARYLREMAQQLVTEDESALAGPSYDPVTANYLYKAVEETVVIYRSHELPAAIDAFMILSLRPMPKARLCLDDWQHPLSEVMRKRLEEAADPITRRSLLVFASCESLSEAVVEGLRICMQKYGYAQVLENWHMLALPAVRETVARLEADDLSQNDHPHGLVAGIGHLPPSAARGLPRWIEVLPLTFRDRLKVYQSLTDHTDTCTRLSCLHGLIAWCEAEIRRAGGDRALFRRLSHPGGMKRIGPGNSHEAVAELQACIARFCSDSKGEIGRIALRYLVRCRWQGLAKLLLKLVNHPQTELRTLASSYLAPMGFNRYWENWPQLSEDQRLAAGRALIKLDSCFHRHLGDRLRDAQINHRLRALAMIGTLNQGAFFEDALIRLMDDDNAPIVASTVKALGSAQSEMAHAAIERALEHRDSRVRANAIEALHEMRCQEHVDELAAMALHEDNRPRANAIAHLLELSNGEAMQALRLMLDDERDDHRNSALWLVHSAGLIEVARQVAEMAISDSDSQIKKRARQVIDELIGAMNRPAGKSPAQIAAEEMTVAADAAGEIEATTTYPTRKG